MALRSRVLHARNENDEQNAMLKRKADMTLTSQNTSNTKTQNSNLNFRK